MNLVHIQTFIFISIYAADSLIQSNESEESLGQRPVPASIPGVVGVKCLAWGANSDMIALPVTELKLTTFWTQTYIPNPQFPV